MSDLDKKRKMKAFIALLDEAIAMGKALNRDIDEMGRILDEHLPSRLAA